MKLEPLHDRVLVKPDPQPKDQLKNGIVIPDTAQQRPSQGTVVAVGEGKMWPDGKWRSLAVVPGDIILFGRFTGSEVTIDDENLLIMREDEIVGVFREEKRAIKAA